MMENSGRHSMIDPHLSALLDELRPTPERDPKVTAANRERFEEELQSYLNSNYATRENPTDVQGSTLQKITMLFRKMTCNYRSGLTVAAIILALVVILFGGAGMTVSAAQDALPGDTLYSVKTGWEQTRVSLTRDEYDQAQMYLGFAEIRLEEIGTLITDERYGDLAAAVDEFEFYIQKAIEVLSGVDATNSERALDLSSRITDALTRFSQILTGMLMQVPESAQVDLERALVTSEGIYVSDDHEDDEIIGTLESITDEIWFVDGQEIRIAPDTEIIGSPIPGDQVNVHVLVGRDGVFTAINIEVVIMVDDGIHSLDDDHSPGEDVGNMYTSGDNIDSDDGNFNSRDDDLDDGDNDDGDTDNDDNNSDDGSINSNDDGMHDDDDEPDATGDDSSDDDDPDSEDDRGGEDGSDQDDEDESDEEDDNSGGT